MFNKLLLMTTSVNLMKSYWLLSPRPISVITHECLRLGNLLGIYSHHLLRERQVENSASPLLQLRQVSNLSFPTSHLWCQSLQLCRCSL